MKRHPTSVPFITSLLREKRPNADLYDDDLSSCMDLTGAIDPSQDPISMPPSLDNPFSPAVPGNTLDAVDAPVITESRPSSVSNAGAIQTLHDQTSLLPPNDGPPTRLSRNSHGTQSRQISRILDDNCISSEAPEAVEAMHEWPFDGSDIVGKLSQYTIVTSYIIVKWPRIDLLQSNDS